MCLRASHRLAPTFLLLAVATSQGQPALNSTFVDAVWVAKTDRVVKIDSGAGTPLLEISDGKFVRVVAVDDVRNTVWVYGDLTLRAYDFSGTYLGSISLPASAKDLGDANGRYVALAVNSNSGLVWLGIEKQLYRLDASSQTFQTFSLRGNVVDLAVDKATSVLWLANRDSVHALTDTGNPVSTIPLAENAQIEDIDVELPSGRLWVASKDTLRRYSSAGTLELELRLGGLQRVAVLDSGEAWAATRDELLLLSSLGTVLSKIPLQRERPVDLVVNPLDTTVWTAKELALAHADRSGRIVHQLDFKGPVIRDVAFYADTIPPTLGFTAPATGAYVNSKAPVLKVSYSDIGTGVNPATLQFQFGGQSLPVACNFSTGGAACTPTSALPEGSISLSASVRDGRGNLSAAASVVFTVDTIPPKITLESHSSGSITSESRHTFSGRVSEPADLKINGQAATVGSDLRFQHGPVVLTEGENPFNFTAADRAGNIGLLTLKITLSTLPPDPATVAPALNQTVASTLNKPRNFFTPERTPSKPASPQGRSRRDAQQSCADASKTEPAPLSPACA